MKLKVKVFRADTQKTEALKYVDGHRKVLQAYGVTQVTSLKYDWIDEPFTYVILVESDDGRVMGGGRIQLAGGNIPLPIETAIDDLDPRIFSIVDEKKRNGGAGEYCGLWNSREIAGFGVGSIILIRVGMAVFTQLPLATLFAFASPATLKPSLDVGYRVLTEVGNDGTFYYPKEDLVATALVLDDPSTLKRATDENRATIFGMRHNPVRTVVEKGPKGEIEVDYNLIVTH